MARLKRWWRRWEWPVVAVAALAAFVLGVLGYRAHFEAAGAARGLAELVYLSLQLFVLESSAQGTEAPPLLHVARFLAPAVSVYTAVQAFAVIFREQWHHVRLSFWRNHVIVCGLGSRGSVLVANLVRAGHRVVALDRAVADERFAAAREGGALVFAGDATDVYTLTRLGLKKARYLVALSGGDGLNAEIALRAREGAGGRRPPLTCLVHIVDPHLCRLLRERRLSDLDDSFRLEFFSIFESGAREVWRDIPPTGVDHLVLVGLGRMGEAILVHGARERARSSLPTRRLNVTVVDRNATTRVGAVTLRYPRLGETCDIHADDMDVESAQFQRGEFLHRHAPAVDAVFVCLDEDARGLTAALGVARHLIAAEVPIVVRVREHAGLAALVEGQAAARNRLRVFGLLDRALDARLLESGVTETLARAVHEEYAAANRNAPRWEDLPEDQRELNRRQADDLSRKLHAINCAVTPISDWSVEPLALTEPEIERLAGMEHGRWLAERQADGWRYAPGAKDPGRKTHPWLMAWEELPEEGKEMNRRNARQLPAFVARVGFGVERREALDVSGSSGVRARRSG